MTSTLPIHPATRLGPVHLAVADLERELDYYRRLGLQLRARTDGIARLGAGSEDLLVLAHRPERGPAPGKAGLFHFAILVPSRADLGRVLRHLLQTDIGVGGASDHAVSEALYLSDPEGNGIEIYRDRSRDEWTYDDGTLRIVTEPMDVESVLAAAEEDGEGAPAWAGFPAGTVIGHVHLQVGDLAAEEHFYETVIGFERVARYGPHATFVSAGGYHHHLGMNTWAGRLAPRTGDELGLDRFTIVLPNHDALAAVRQRLDENGTLYQEQNGGLLVQDPQGFNLYLTIDTP